MRYSSKYNWAWLCAAGLVIGLTPAWAAGHARPEIISVRQQKDAAHRRGATPHHRSRRLPSLNIDVDHVPSFKEKYQVTWSPGAQGLPAGTTVRFYYQQAASRKPAALEIRYPFEVTTHRTATFVIPEKVIRNKGPVTAWRVVLYRNRNMLATRHSANWK